MYKDYSGPGGIPAVQCPQTKAEEIAKRGRWSVSEEDYETALKCAIEMHPYTMSWIDAVLATGTDDMRAKLIKKYSNKKLDVIDFIFNNES